MKQLVRPLELVSPRTFYTLVVGELVLALLLWMKFSMNLIPGPIQVARALSTLLTTQEFYQALISSLSLTLKGMFISILISLAISYTYFIPMLRPLGMFIVKCRYLTLTGLIFFFTLLTKDGSELKMSLLIFGIVPFFVTSMISELASINVQEFEMCKTLRMGAWETWTEVIIIGRLDHVVETLRQNFAIAWLMITMIEGLSMSEGGLGVLLIKANKYVDMPKVFALLVVVLALGIIFDFLLGFIRLWLFPYTRLMVMK